jgi:hypothetical protein
MLNCSCMMYMVVLLIVLKCVLLLSNLVYTFQSPCSEYVTRFAGINKCLYVHEHWQGKGGKRISASQLNFGGGGGGRKGRI